MEYISSTHNLRTSAIILLLSILVSSAPLLNSHCFSSSLAAPIGPWPVSPGLHPCLCFRHGRTLCKLLLLHQASSLPRTRNLVASFQFTPSHFKLLSIAASATSLADSVFVMLGNRLTASLPTATIGLLLSWIHSLPTSLLLILSHLLNEFVLACLSCSLFSLSLLDRFFLLLCWSLLLLCSCSPLPPCCSSAFPSRQSPHPHSPGASSILLLNSSLSPIGSSFSCSGSQTLLTSFNLSILFNRSSSLITSDDFSIMEFASGSSNQLMISLRCEFIPPFPPITGRVGGGVPLLLVQFLWSLKSSHNGQDSKLLLMVLSLHLLSWLLSFPTLKIFSNMLTAPLILLWLAFISSTPTSWSSLIWTSPAVMYVSIDITANLPDLSVGKITISPSATLFFILFRPICSSLLRFAVCSFLQLQFAATHSLWWWSSSARITSRLFS